MDDLASLRERIATRISDKIISKVLSGEAKNHFKNGYKTACQCSVCSYRRDYAHRQSQKLSHQWSPSIFGGWFNEREHRRELNRAFKSRVIEELETGAISPLEKGE